jgi:hypothetical protein
MNLSRVVLPLHGLMFLLYICLFSSTKAFSQVESDSNAIEIPVGGNSWLINALPGEEITEAGLVNWKSASTICRSYFRTSSPGVIRIWLFIEHADTAGIIQIKLGNTSRKILLQTGHGNRIDAGEWKLADTGYVQIDLRGLMKKDSIYGNLTTIRVEGTPVNNGSSYVQNNDDNYFYWGRRGPSVHLNYKVDTSFKASWFYNEITVPAGNDIIGSYFMANGFAEGYFGIQVNSKVERRILFSIWSPFHTDDPASIPDSLKIKLLAKGANVYTGEFGNEGSGGQSYYKFNWKAGNKYGFLTHAQPNAGNTTTFTSWFYAPETGRWKLIASFERPSTSTQLRRLHSFLENFEPETGMVSRKVYFTRQFVADESGHWQELTVANFSVDQTGRKNFRKDYYGAVTGNAFMLQNCGFFNSYQLPGTILTRTNSAKAPPINFSSLPLR